jgi:excisionase family DNA binding protein
MEDFLTTRQVLDILKVDRITIYRMLNDGRLKGTKIGQQWRFSRAEVESLLNGEKFATTSNRIADDSGLPVHCLQAIQDLFGAVSQYSAVLISPQGELITEISNPCRFCQIFRTNPTSIEACRNSQIAFAEQSKKGQNRFTCHAGLHYVGTQVFVGDEPVGLFLVGGYSLEPGDPGEKTAFLDQLGGKFGISRNLLTAAYEQIPTVQQDEQLQLELWANSAAHAFESILRERLGFARRLKKIADLTQIA